MTGYRKPSHVSSSDNISVSSGPRLILKTTSRNTKRTDLRTTHAAPALAETNSDNADCGSSSSTPRSVNDRAPGRYVSFHINSNIPYLGLEVAASRLNESCGGRNNRTPCTIPRVGANKFQYPNNDR